MKKFNPLLILIAILFVSCGKERKVMLQPAEVGDKVFKLLKDMNKISAPEFADRVITYGEIKNLREDKDAPLGDYLRSELHTITPETFKSVSTSEYNEIKTKGTQYGIDWDKIAFVSMKHDFQMADEGKILLAETYFKNTDGKVYFVKAAAFFDGKGYILGKVAEIEPENRGSFK
jgi:hypothetical protein